VVQTANHTSSRAGIPFQRFQSIRQCSRLALPLNHAAFPRNAAQLKELGAGYSNCAPTPETRLLRSMQEQCAAQRNLLG
jgi:hypothetical protein